VNALVSELFGLEDQVAVATGAAIADVNPFTSIAAFVGIGAADHAQTPWGAQTRSSCKSAHPASRPS
jgi:hypothetical protein